MNGEMKPQSGMPEENPSLPARETIKKLALRFGITLAASMILGLGSAALTGWVMVQLLDSRVTILETKVKEQSPLTGKVDKLETTIERHEKALDRDFLRHEQIVAGLSVKTEDQEKRLTRVEALVGEVQATLKEIQMDIKTLLRGKPTGMWAPQGGARRFAHKAQATHECPAGTQGRKVCGEVAMSFKQDVENDIFAVFLNLEEFGERAEIAGHRDVPMVVESLALEMPPSASDGRGGVSYEGLTVYVAASDVPEELFPQKTVTFRDEEWFVLSSACDCGLKTIQLYRERA